ncbi:MAG TPA: DUF1206 domain-containing protein [Jatrophihabitans sp.]|jgi:hypothetical protein|nr:DUF1206 domain-containing protein [Jatrophihabitans sp.]
MTQVALSARQAARSSTMDRLARFGCTARAIVYLVIGWLGLQIALGNHPHQANQRGALAEIAQGDLGLALLWILGFGLGAYAVWRLSEAAVGSRADGAGKGARAKSAARGLIYAGACVSTFAFIAGASRTSQSHEQVAFTARVMRDSGGRWLVGAVGFVIVIVGVYLCAEGITRRFERQLRMAEMAPRTRLVVSRLGMVGTIARGVVFAIAGILVIAAAVTFDPRKSSGLDGAMRTLAHQPYGPWLLAALAIGLIAFGAFGFAQARWVKT